MGHPQCNCNCMDDLLSYVLQQHKERRLLDDHRICRKGRNRQEPDVGMSLSRDDFLADGGIGRTKAVVAMVVSEWW